MVKIPELWSTYQKYGQHTRNMVNIPEVWKGRKKERVRPVTIGSDKYPKNVQTLQLQLMSNEKLLCPAGEINLVISFCAKKQILL